MKERRINICTMLLTVTVLITTLAGASLGESAVEGPGELENQTMAPSPGMQDEKSEKHPQVGRENTVMKTKVDILGGILKRLLRRLKESTDPRVELVFLVDSSASVGTENFFNEIRFVRKLLSDFTITSEAVRVALVTFSSKHRIIRHIDHLRPDPSGIKNHKCSLMQDELPRITYTGGGTYTLGAMLEAEAILRNARRGARKVVFLITDGYSNGGDPVPVAQRLKETRSGRGQRKGSEDGTENFEEVNEGKVKKNNRNRGVEIFTFGIRNGNTQELLAMATDKDHTFILGSFKEFEALGRRAFHQDLQIGTFLKLNSSSCNKLCSLKKSASDKQCCDSMATCACGTISGHYSCICPPGHYGTGLQNDCHPCPKGTYNPGELPGDVHTSCRRCPDPNQTTRKEGAVSPEECECQQGFVPDARGMKCIAITCPPLNPPENGYFARTISGKRSGRRRIGRASRDKALNQNRKIHDSNRESCPNLSFKSSCGVRCKNGFTLVGSHIRTCGPNGHWTGQEPSCVIKKCPSLRQPKDGIIRCEENLVSLSGNVSSIQGSKEGHMPNSVCHFECNNGYHLVGSEKRTCLPSGIWDGLQAYCKAKTCPPLQTIPHGKVFPPSCLSRQQLSPAITSCLLVCDEGYILWGVRERLEWETNQGKLVCGSEGNWELTNPEVGSAREALAWKRGKWTGGRCVDIEPPIIKCPDNKTVETEKDKKFAVVQWEQPETYDNSGIPVTLNIVPAMSWPAKLPIGENEITIVARDANRNKAKCKFIVTVIDKQPPTIHMCETPPPFVLPSEPSVVIAESRSQGPKQAHGLIWNQPVFEDNSEQNLTVEVRAYMGSFLEPKVWEGLDGGQGETFPIGDTVILYTVSDPYGNNNTCEILITVKDHACPLLPDPINGNSNCSKGREIDSTSLLCTLTCAEGYAFPIETPQDYFCSPQMEMTISETVAIGFNKWGDRNNPGSAMAFNRVGQSDYVSWEPQETLPFADCMVAAIPNTLQQDGLIFIEGDNSICNDSAFYQQVEESVRRKISEKLAEICGVGTVGIQCEIVGEIEQVCESLVSTAEEEANAVMASSVTRNEESHSRVKDGSRVRKGRRNGGRRRKLQEEMKKKRKGRQMRKGKEQKRKGRARQQQGRKKNGGAKKQQELPEESKKIELHTEKAVVPESIEAEGHVILTRRKRSVGESLEEESLESTEKSDDEPIDEEADDDGSEDEEDTEISEGQTFGVGVYFKMVGPIKNSSNSNKSAESIPLENLLEEVKKALEDAITKGDFNVEIPVQDKGFNGSQVLKKVLTSSIGFETPRFGCQKGSILNKNLCVKCPSGTFWDETSEVCLLCKKGTYQPLEGQLFCQNCPVGFSTNIPGRQRHKRRATSLDDCIPECEPGTYSVDGLHPCSTCPKGYFNHLNGSLRCTLCPANKTTTFRGAKSSHDCVDLCAPDTVSETGVYPCYPCPNGYHQPNAGKTHCEKKQHMEEANPFSNTSFINELGLLPQEIQGDILPYNECFTSPCKNGGTCYVFSNSGIVCGCELGFIGTFCELEENMCENEPCLNDGKCQPNGSSYSCSCSPEFTGENCELRSDSCTPNPCANGGTCSSYESDYECLCPADFEGTHCEKTICDSPSCTSNSSCVFNGEEWECLCGSDSSEDDCTVEGMLLDGEGGLDEDAFLSSDSVLHFPQSGTTNYVLVTGYSEKNYTRISLCGWMNTTDRSNYGTVFSLATAGSDNAFTLTDYSGFVIYVNGNSISTDVSANDGKWHHFCVTWASQKGNWNLFLNGHLAAAGEGLSPGYVIPGQATIVLGQDQDWEGGGFSEAESFVGRLALVTLENKIISAEEAVNRATYCKSGGREAMIWSWADFLYERQGKIEVEESQLCKKCPLATPPKNGLVVYLEKDKDSEIDDAVNGLVVKYSCINGFTLSKGQDIRNCLVNATWDGKQPTCKRVSCDSTDTESNIGATNTKCKGKKKFFNSQQILNTTDVPEVNTKEDALPSTHEPLLTISEENATHTNVQETNATHTDVQENNATHDLNGQNSTEHEVAQEKDILHEVEELDLNSIDNDTRCIGPYGIGRINGWISYGEAYGLEGSQSNHRRGLFGIGTQLDIECDIGFQLMGESQIVCTLGGKWRKRFNYSSSDAELNPQILLAVFERGEEVLLPKCVPVTCGSPPEIGQGAWEIMERKHWNGGDGLRWNKVWHKYMSKESIYSNVEIESQPKDVVIPSKSESREEFKYGDVAEYDCEYGYALIGPQALYCSQNGIWEWSSRHSRWPGLEYAPRHYPPDKWPHNLDSQKMISKAIEARPAVCLPVRCSMPLPPINGGYVERREINDPKAKSKHLDHPDAYYVGDEVINSCVDKNVSSTTVKRKRQLIGPRLRRCLPSGQWSSYRPRCKDL